MILRKLGDCEQAHARIKLVSLFGGTFREIQKLAAGETSSRRVLRKHVTDTFYWYKDDAKE